MLDQPLLREKAKYPSRVQAKQQRVTKGLPGVGLTAAQANAAIDRGAAGLWKHLQDRIKAYPSNRFGDDARDLPVARALVHVKYHQNDPTFDATLRALVGRWNPTKSYQTY